MFRALGGEILEVQEGYARGRLPLSDLTRQPSQVFHAGAICALADKVASVAIDGGFATEGYMPGKFFPYSVQISMSLLANDNQGPLSAEAKIVKRGRMTVVQTVVTTCKGEIAALVTSTHMLVELKRNDG